MRAYIISKYSKTEPMQLVEIPEPTIGENDILVEIYASSLNQLDAKIKSGEFKLLLPYKFPLTLGHDVAGIVKKVGSKVTKFKVGDAVISRVPDYKIGTLAEYIAINENEVALKPNNISMEEAASIPLVSLTVWQAFFEKYDLQKGQKVFIQAGSGGVGTIAIQVAKNVGAFVATTTSADNFELVKNLGADIVIDYKKQDFETILKDYDMVLNSQDAETLEKSLRILKPNGKAVSISGPPDKNFAKEFGLPWYMKMIMSFLSNKIVKLAKKLNVNYSFLFMKANGSQLSQISQLIEQGKIRPVVDKIYPFDQMNEALSYVASGRAKGKVVVKVR